MYRLMKRLALTILLTTAITAPVFGMNTEYSYLKFQDGFDEYTYQVKKTPQSTDNPDDELHYTPRSVSANNAYSTKYGAKMSYDEIRVPGVALQANDGYEQSTYSELHINPYYRNNVYYNPKGYRIEGFDEFYYVNER